MLRTCHPRNLVTPNAVSVQYVTGTFFARPNYKEDLCVYSVEEYVFENFRYLRYRYCNDVWGVTSTSSFTALSVCHYTG